MLKCSSDLLFECVSVYEFSSSSFLVFKSVLKCFQSVYKSFQSVSVLLLKVFLFECFNVLPYCSSLTVRSASSDDKNIFTINLFNLKKSESVLISKNT